MTLTTMIGRIGISFMLVSAIFLADASGASRSLIVQADGVEQDNADMYLKMSVWNCGNQTVSIEEADLPWSEGATGLTIYVGRGSRGQMIKRIHNIADFAAHQISILPKKSLQGRINLNFDFPDLTHLKNVNDAAIFWLYDIRGEIPPAGRFGGMMALGKPMVEPERNPCVNIIH